MKESEFLELQKTLNRQEEELKIEVLKFAINKILVDFRLHNHKGEIVLEFIFFSSSLCSPYFTGFTINASNCPKGVYSLGERVDFNFVFPYMTIKQLQEFVSKNYDDVVIQVDERRNWLFWAIFKNYPEIDETKDSIPIQKIIE